MNRNVVGLDIAKNVFHFYSMGPDHKMTQKKLKRSELLGFFANYPPSEIGLEACGGAHHRGQFDAAALVGRLGYGLI